MSSKNSSFNHYHRYVNPSELCRCKNGHVFQYKDRKKITEKEAEHYAPCQGRCPECDTTTFSFIGNGINIYPITYSPQAAGRKAQKDKDKYR